MKIITKIDIENILNKIQFIGDNGTKLEIRNIEPYQTAFVHKSYLTESNVVKSNEVLEYLGDGFIGAIVGKYLVDRFENEQEGFLTKTRTRLVRSSMLYRFARYLLLGEFLLLSQQVEKLTQLGPNKGRNNPRFYEDCFEAFVGAIIEDFGDEDGYRYAKRFLISIIEYIVDFADIILCNENHKDILQRYFQAQVLKWPNPVYIDLAEIGPFHMRVFIKGVFLKKTLLQQLSEEVQKQAIVYHNEQLLNNNSKVVQSIKNHSESTNSYLIGLGSANKKIIAEQICSSIALCCLSVEENPEGGFQRTPNHDFEGKFV